VSRLISRFGTGLVIVFIPLLLISRGLKLWQVCAFYVCYAFAKLLVNYPSTLLINKYGARLGLIVGLIATTVFMMLLTWYVANAMIWLLLAMAIAMALQNSFTWNAEHLHISRVMDVARKSRDLAAIESMLRVAGIATPVIGGFIVAFFGQVWLTAIASFLVALAIIPIWHLDKLGGGHVRITDLRYNLRQAPVRDMIANFGYNAHTLVGIMVWPIYLAVFIPNFRDIGIITSIAALIAVIVLLIAGKRGDNGKSYRVLVEGTAASSGVHIARILASSNPIVITIISALYDVALTYQANPWTSLYYAHSRKGSINYIMSMEIVGDLAYLTLWTLLGVTAYFVGESTFFIVAFSFAAIIAWLCLLMRKERAEPISPA
jgi:MFS family permease